MERRDCIRILTASGAALGVLALGVGRADALLGPTINSNDRLLNFAQRSNGSAGFSMAINDGGGGWSTGWVEENGSDGVRVRLDSQGGSAYMKGFARCQNGGTVSAVYTFQDTTADGSNSTYSAWCSWLGAGWSRIAWGGLFNTSLTNPPGGTAPDRLISAGQGTNASVPIKVGNWFLSPYNTNYPAPSWTTSNIMVTQVGTLSVACC